MTHSTYSLKRKLYLEILSADGNFKRIVSDKMKKYSSRFLAIFSRFLLLCFRHFNLNIADSNYRNTLFIGCIMGKVKCFLCHPKCLNKKSLDILDG